MGPERASVCSEDVRTQSAQCYSWTTDLRAGWRAVWHGRLLPSWTLHLHSACGGNLWRPSFPHRASARPPPLRHTHYSLSWLASRRILHSTLYYTSEARPRQILCKPLPTPARSSFPPPPPAVRTTGPAASCLRSHRLDYGKWQLRLPSSSSPNQLSRQIKPGQTRPDIRPGPSSTWSRVRRC